LSYNTTKQGAKLLIPRRNLQLKKQISRSVSEVGLLFKFWGIERIEGKEARASSGRLASVMRAKGFRDG